MKISQEHLVGSRIMIWILFGPALALFIYFAGGIATGVIFSRHTLQEGSLASRALTVIYTPLRDLAQVSPSFRRTWISCMAIFLPPPLTDTHVALLRRT